MVATTYNNNACNSWVIGYIWAKQCNNTFHIRTILNKMRLRKIVNSFEKTGIDYLVMNEFLVKKPIPK